MKTLLIINPVSGKIKLKSVLFDIVKVLSDAGHIVTVITTKYSKHATEIARAACAKGYELIICGGGDGTFNEVVNGLMLSDAPPLMGYIPAGSTNDFASTMGLSLNPIEAAKSIANGTEHTIDVGKFQDRFFCYTASFGAFTKASYSARQEVKNAIGYLAYVLEGLKDLSDIRPKHIKVITPDKEYEGDYIFGMVSNSMSFGKIVKLKSSLVSLNDGLFETLLIKNPRNAAELTAIMRGIQRSSFDSNMFDFFHCSNVEFCTDNPMPWTLDGEFEPGSESVKILNYPSAIRIIK